MDDLARSNGTGISPVISGAELQIAMRALNSALQAGIELARVSENGKSQRALIQAQKELNILQIERENDRNMALDAQLHERRMTLIKGITELLLLNATNMTESTKQTCMLFLMVLREER